MIIGLDYDRTFSKDIEFWKKFIVFCKVSGHEIYIVTHRDKALDRIDGDISVGVDDQGGYHITDLGREEYVIPIFYTNGAAKRFYMNLQRDYNVDIWIDDKPESVLYNSTATKEVLAEWRANGRQ